MSKKIVAALVVLCMIFAMSITSMAADDYLYLGDIDNNTTGWWVVSQEGAEGIFAVAFTSSAPITGIELNMMAGNNVAADYSLYVYNNTIEDTLTGTPLVTKNIVVNGDHTNTNEMIKFEFGKTFAAGRYVLSIEYTDASYRSDGHLVVNSATEAEDTAAMDVELYFEGWITNGDTRDCVSARLVVGNEADVEPVTPPADDGNGDGDNTNPPAAGGDDNGDNTNPPADSGNDNNDDNKTPDQGNANTADNAVIAIIAAAAIAFAAAVIVRRRVTD